MFKRTRMGPLRRYAKLLNLTYPHQRRHQRLSMAKLLKACALTRSRLSLTARRQLLNGRVWASGENKPSTVTRRGAFSNQNMCTGTRVVRGMFKRHRMGPLRRYAKLLNLTYPHQRRHQRLSMAKLLKACALTRLRLSMNARRQ